MLASAMSIRCNRGTLFATLDVSHSSLVDIYMSGDKQTPIRIALADDEPIFRQMLVLLLERLGHEVACAAANGAELVDGGLDDIDRSGNR